MMRIFLLSLIGLAALAPRLAAQPGGTTRVGISLGGISTVGFVVEVLDGHGSVELNVGTWSFRDLSVSVVRRHYFGVADARPSVGLGLWGILGFPSEERPSAALVVRAPVGLAWTPGDGHVLTLDINVNQGLWIRRSDPEDDTPMSRRLIPLPGASYRWWSR